MFFYFDLFEFSAAILEKGLSWLSPVVSLSLFDKNSYDEKDY